MDNDNDDHVVRQHRALHELRDAYVSYSHQGDVTSAANVLRTLVEMFDSTKSLLLQHEIAFTMGQLGSDVYLDKLQDW